MKTELQLLLSAFDPSTEPVCEGKPESNGFRMLCYHCPFSEKRASGLFCMRYRRTIGARAKYSLPEWKKVRRSILERDGYSCSVCRSERWLCIHHRDQNPANDDPENLITLCDVCHARIHTLRSGGEHCGAKY